MSGGVCVKKAETHPANTLDCPMTADIDADIDILKKDASKWILAMAAFKMPLLGDTVKLRYAVCVLVRGPMSVISNSITAKSGSRGFCEPLLSCSPGAVGTGGGGRHAVHRGLYAASTTRLHGRHVTFWDF